VKATLKQWITERRHEEILALTRQDKKVLTRLMAFLYDREERVCWRAVEAMGLVAAQVAERDLEFVRNVLRRLLWSLNDESGSIGWFAPQALGEIIHHQPEALADFIPVVTGLLELEEEVFRPGTLWALGRIGQPVQEKSPEVVPLVGQYLSASAPEIRGLAVWCLGQLQVAEAQSSLEELAKDDAPVRVFEGGELLTTTIGQLAQRVLKGEQKNWRESLTR